MYNIGIDAMGGDNGISFCIDAIISSLNKQDDLKFTIFGNENEIRACFKSKNFSSNNIEIINCSEKIEMNDHPVFAIREKTNSSIVKAAYALKNSEIDAFISAGSTGALIAIAQFVLKPIAGIDRPVLGAIIPTNKTPMLLIDSGCNVDSKPAWLYQYAKLSNTYYKLMFDKKEPTIGLLSVGTEENKGNNLTLETYKLIKEDTSLNFIGNVEARDLMYGVSDIVVTDGFAGNVFLKTYEGTATLILKLLKDEIKSSFISMLGGLLIKPKLKSILSKYDATVYGGAPILGTNALVIKIHGNSKTGEYISSINQTKTLLSKNLIQNLKNSF